MYSWYPWQSDAPWFLLTEVECEFYYTHIMHSARYEVGNMSDRNVECKLIKYEHTKMHEIHICYFDQQAYTNIYRPNSARILRLFSFINYSYIFNPIVILEGVHTWMYTHMHINVYIIICDVQVYMCVYLCACVTFWSTQIATKQYMPPEGQPVCLVYRENNSWTLGIFRTGLAYEPTYQIKQQSSYSISWTKSDNTEWYITPPDPCITRCCLILMNVDSQFQALLCKIPCIHTR